MNYAILENLEDLLFFVPVLVMIIVLELLYL